MAIEIYCVRCKAKTDSENPEPFTMKNGRDAVTSVCKVCGTKKFQIGKMPVAA